MTRARMLLVAALVGVVGLSAAACDDNTEVTVAAPEQTGIAVSGQGTVTVVPDIGIIHIGIEVSRPAVADARSQAAATMEALRGAVRRNGVDEKDIATSFFNIYPQYDVSPPRPLPGGGPQQPQIVGFTVNNQVAVKVRKVDDVSKVLDAAIAAGGNAVRVNNVSFTVDQPERFQSEARDKAMANARERAEQLAKAAGVKLGKVRAVSESFGGPDGPVPVRQAAPAARGGQDVPSPVSPGEAQVVLTVNVVYDVD